MFKATTLILPSPIPTRTTRTVGFISLRALATSTPILAGRQPSGGRRDRAKNPFDIDTMADEPFAFNDQTTVGHELYNNIKEVRKYLRKSVYELPQLSKFAKPFTPPTASQILCFKSHNYMGEPHPVERKVVLTVKVSDIKLTDTERHKLLLLCGPRYNPERDELKFSAERFPYRPQNKKYLSDLFDRVVEEAKNAEETFESIPLDTRHVKPKKHLKFPPEWIRKKVVPDAPGPEGASLGAAEAGAAIST